MYLHLDPLFKPYSSDEISYEKMTFSGGEPHLKIQSKIPSNTKITITARIRSFNDLGFICLAADALRRMQCIPDTLIIPYFPAARQDRVMIGGEPLTVKVYSNIINSLGFNKVVIYDAHSEVTPALLDHVEAINNHSFIQRVIQDIGNDVLLISPDGGALKKIYKLSEFLGGKEVIECSKSRNVATGQLTNFKVYAETLENRNCLIVDDICDGGGTFFGLAEELKKKGAGKLYLAISHGIFSRGFEQLNCFEKIYTTDSFQNIENQLVKQILLGDGLLS